MPDTPSPALLPQPRPAAASWRGLLLVALVALLAQAATLGGTAALDDVPVVASNPALERGLGALPATFREPQWPGQLEQQPWRPLASVSLHVEHALAPGEAALRVGHVTQLLLHACVALLATLLAWRVAPGRTLLGLGVGLVVAAHPLATCAVALLVGRSVLLGTALALGALVLAVGWRPGQHARLAWAGTLALLALLACEAWAALPLVALLLVRSAAAADPTRPRRAAWLPPLAIAAGTAVWLALWWRHGPGACAVDVAEPGPWARLALGLEAAARGVLHVAVPVGWVADRTHEALPGRGWVLEGGRLLAVFLAGVALLAAGLVPLRRGALAALRPALLGGGLVLLGAALVLPLGAVLEDRWGYLALPAWAVAAGLCAESVARWAQGSTARRTLAAWMPGLVLLCFTLLGVRVAQGLSDDDVAHRRLMALPGGHGPALLRRAERLRLEGERLHAQAMRLPVRNPDPARDPGRGPLLAAAREARSQAMDLALAATRQPATREDPQAWLVLGLLQLDTPTPADALETLARARRLHPLLSAQGEAAAGASVASRRQAARIYSALARAQATQGRQQAAADAAAEALKHENVAAGLAGSPPDMDLVLRAAVVLAADGRYELALPALEQVALGHPEASVRAQVATQLRDAREARAERVATLLRSGRASQESPDTMRLAIDDYEEALRLDPASFEARYWTAQIRAMHFGSYALALDILREGLARLARERPSPEVERQRARFEELQRLVEQRQQADERADGEGREGEGRDGR
ncbi:MAG: hypothetical protein ACKOSS_11585 [Planctomycetia bacterium]